MLMFVWQAIKCKHMIKIVLAQHLNDLCVGHGSVKCRKEDTIKYMLRKSTDVRLHNSKCDYVEIQSVCCNVNYECILKSEA